MDETQEYCTVCNACRSRNSLRRLLGPRARLRRSCIAQPHNVLQRSSLTIYGLTTIHKTTTPTLCKSQATHVSRPAICCLHRARGGRTKVKYWQLLVAVARGR